MLFTVLSYCVLRLLFLLLLNLFAWILKLSFFFLIGFLFYYKSVARLFSKLCNLLSVHANTLGILTNASFWRNPSESLWLPPVWTDCSLDLLHRCPLGCSLHSYPGDPLFPGTHFFLSQFGGAYLSEDSWERVRGGKMTVRQDHYWGTVRILWVSVRVFILTFNWEFGYRIVDWEWFSLRILKALFYDPCYTTGMSFKSWIQTPSERELLSTRCSRTM